MLKRAQELKKKIPVVSAILQGQMKTAEFEKLLAEAKSLNSRSVELDELKLNALLVPESIGKDAVRLCSDNFARLSQWLQSISTWNFEGDKLQLKGAITSSKSAIDDILVHWRRAWTTGIRDEFSGLPDLALLLEDAKGGKPAADKLRKAATLSQQVENVQTPRTSERKKLSDARQLKLEALEMLSKSGANNEVVAFLTAVANGTCTLLLVNGTILDWLTENGQLSKFRVRRN